jgi:hypothetical protein
MIRPVIRSLSLTTLGIVAALTIGAAAHARDIPRTPDGRPDLSGTYDVATLTPLQRPEAFGDNLFLTPEQAEQMQQEEQRLMAEGAKRSDPNRNAPPVGGDGSTGAAGNVGGYNTFWIDRGDSVIMVDGKFRTSILTDPPNGRFPALTERAARDFMARRAAFRENTGEAWWMPGPGPYDDPEQRPLGERCLLGFGSTAGPPMLPVLYNNLKRIVQTPDSIVILVEMNHDARMVRMNAEHAPQDQRFWLGDSIGWWEGDTLVVDTTNFRDESGLGGATRDLHVVERFTRQADGSLLYSFTVSDPNVWTAPWSGEYPWPRTEDRLFEYACHEGNYALGNILRGARLLEQDAQAAAESAAADGASGSR